MRPWIAITLAAASLAAAPAGAAAKEKLTPQERLAKMLEGRVAAALGDEDRRRRPRQRRQRAAVMEEDVEVVRERGVVVHAERIAAGTAGCLRLFEGIRAKLVTLLALLLIGKDAVSLIGFLEFVHGFFVALIAVRRIFQGQFTECFFYFVLGSSFAYSQYLIIISLSQNRRLLKLF